MPARSRPNRRVEDGCGYNDRRTVLARRPDGIYVAPFEAGEIGPDLFRKACEFGLEGLVSKRRDSLYRPGRSPSWIKVKNRQHPAMERVKEAFA
jgi:bifunctional non-homologous end joining protein LigD